MVPEGPRAAGAPGVVARVGSRMTDLGRGDANPGPKGGTVPLGVGGGGNPDCERWASLQGFLRLPLPHIQCLGLLGLLSPTYLSEATQVGTPGDSDAATI